MTGPEESKLPVKNLPDFPTFRRLYWPRYTRYAEWRLGSRAQAEEAAREGFALIKAAWRDILASADPPALAWQVLQELINSRADEQPVASTEDEANQTEPHAAPLLEGQLLAGFEKFHRDYRPKFVSYAQRCLGSYHDAQEAVDHGFVHVVIRWPEILEKTSPEAYVFAVMKNAITDFARRRARRGTLTDTTAMERLIFETVAVQNACHPISELENAMCLYQAVRQLSDRQRQVIYFRYYERRTPAQTAGMLGVAPSTVRSIERYAKRELRKIYEREEGEGQ